MKAKAFLFLLSISSAAVLRSFALTYGVSAGNSAGISDYTDGGGAPELPDDEKEDALENGDAHYWARLRQPRIQRADRITASSVEIEWKCEQVGFNPGVAKIIIMRQTHNGDWVQVHVEDFQTSGTWTDTAAAIGPTYRYSAYTAIDHVESIHASDAGDPVLVEYHPVNLVSVGYRGSTENVNRTPPGGAVTGSDPKKIDKHSFAVLPLMPNKVPALITSETTANTPTFSVADLTRYWDDDHPTSFAVNGHIVHGRAFSLNARVLVGHGEYGGAMVEINSKTPAGVHGGFEMKGKTGDPYYFVDYKGIFSEVIIPALSFEGIAEEGFDNATFFACQHIPTGGTIRNVKLVGRPSMSGSPIDIPHTGPFTTNPVDALPAAQEMPFQVQTTGTIGGDVIEQKTQHQLRLFGLTARTWTVNTYRVDVDDFYTGSHYDGVEPPDDQALQDALNAVFGKQANVTFQVTKHSKITVNTLNFQPSSPVGVPWDHNSKAMRRTLWATATPTSDFALFYVPDTEPGALAEAFDIPSRGAVVGPRSSSFGDVAHELGHCMGLQHCWTSRLPNSGMDAIPDKMGNRLMGYGSSRLLLLRHEEIETVNEFIPTGRNPLGPNVPFP